MRRISAPTIALGAVLGGGGLISVSGCGASGHAAAGRDLSPNRAAFFGQSRCADAHVQLCEDFESGALDPATWQVGGDPPVIDTLQAARGTRALHVTKTGNGLSYVSESKTFPEPNDTYFGRAFVYFKSLPESATNFSYAHWTFVAASGTGVSGEIRLSGQLQSGANLFGVGTDSLTDPAGTGDWTNADRDPGPNGTPTPVPLGQWLCIEWMHDGAHNQTRFWWDAVEHPSLGTTSTTPHQGNAGLPFTLPRFTNLWLGWQEYQASSERFEMWLDEIAIDGSRIGCVD
ncbi:MAG TPA: hypothetical protein VFG23_27950 [Polyangia bacterium]|nr:hypothetical protein [Polyangia bacterium]